MTGRPSRLIASRADLAGLISSAFGVAAARSFRAANRFVPAKRASVVQENVWHPATQFERSRGTTSENARGSAEDRRRRKNYLLSTFGDGVTAPCAFCKVALTFDTVTVDRYPIPGKLGGRYIHGNIRPACGRCNTEDQGRAGVLAATEGAPNE